MFAVWASPLRAGEIVVDFTKAKSPLTVPETVEPVAAAAIEPAVMPLTAEIVQQTAGEVFAKMQADVTAKTALASRVQDNISGLKPSPEQTERVAVLENQLEKLEMALQLLSAKIEETANKLKALETIEEKTSVSEAQNESTPR